MRLVDRLLLREVSGPLFNSVLMFLMLLFTSAYLFKMTDLLVRGASFTLVAQVALYSLPMLVTQTLPMGLLLACLLAFGRLSGDSEHIALFASGISFYRAVWPIAGVGLLLSVLAFAWNETVVPPATREFYRLQQKALENIQETEKPLRYDVKRKGEESVDEVVIIEGGYNAKTKTVRKVTIVKMSDEPLRKGMPEAVIYADHATVRDPKGHDWTFYDGYVKYLRPDPNSRVQADLHFQEARTLPKNVRMERDFASIMQSDVTDNRRMTFRQLRDKINRERAQGSLSTLGDEVDLWSKLSLPLASLIFGLVGAPLGIQPQRGGKTMGFGIAIGIIFVYWVVHNWMFQVGKGGGLPPLLASFTADLLGVAAAAVLVARTRQ